jgi:acetyltransferase-like isoleucine patch superfamily enzyme
MFRALVHRLLMWLERQNVRYYMAKMNIGKRVTIKRGLRARSPGNITIGNDVSIGCNVILQAHAPIYIGDFTKIAPGVIIITASHDTSKRGIERIRTTSPVWIGSNCWLGAGAIVLPGVTIGDGTIVGAGGVVTRDLPQEMICVGVPSKPLKPRPKS